MTKHRVLLNVLLMLLVIAFISNLLLSTEAFAEVMDNSGTKMISEDDAQKKNIIITLHRTMCFGTCPVYKLTIYGDGTVIYEGKKFVKDIGIKTTTINEEKVRQLVSEFKKINYFSLKDSYDETGITDMPYALTSITIDDKTKSIRHYYGDPNAPKELTQLEKRIDEIAGSKQWTETKSTEPPLLNSTYEMPQKAETRKAEIMRAFAKSLRDEAYSLQMKGHLNEAIIKYRKSLTYWPDSDLENHIQLLEKKSGELFPDNQPAASPESITNKTQRVITATIRNRSNEGVHIFTQGETFNPNNHFMPQEIRFVPVQIQSNGEVIFYAGRDGRILDSKTWRGDPRYQDRVPCVLFDKEKLIILTGIR